MPTTSRLWRRLTVLMLGMGAMVGGPARAEDDVHRELSAFYAATASAVVALTVRIDEEAGRRGAGVVVTGDGLVLTRRHVIWDTRLQRPPGRLIVHFAPTARAAAQPDFPDNADYVVLAEDKTLDVALLKPISTQKRTALPLAARPLRSDQRVLVYAFPQGHRWSVALGSLAGAGKVWEVALPPEVREAGTPLLNGAGEVIGLMGAKAEGAARVPVLPSDRIAAWVAAKTHGAKVTAPAHVDMASFEATPVLWMPVEGLIPTPSAP